VTKLRREFNFLNPFRLLLFRALAKRMSYLLINDYRSDYEYSEGFTAGKLGDDLAHRGWVCSVERMTAGL
jgi:hypothetical protein